MTELKAWRDVDMTALERELLMAARSDRMPAELGLRVSSALAAGAAASASGSAAAQGGLWFGKSGLWGVLSLVVLTSAGVYYASAFAPHTPTRVAPRAALAPTTVIEPATSVAPIEAPSVQLEPSPRAQAAAPLDADSLRQEVRLLDRARVALDRGAANDALALLEQHGTRFAHGTLVPEAEALRIEALAQSGEADQAHARLQRFLSAHPSHPMNDRLRALKR